VRSHRDLFTACVVNSLSTAANLLFPDDFTHGVVAALITGCSLTIVFT
jgi:hypothetical protein